MQLNNIQAAQGAKHSSVALAVYRSGLAKQPDADTKVKITFRCFHKVGFEGGQMPLQRRLPKRGFGFADTL